MANPAKEKKSKEGRDEGSGMLRRLLEEVTALRGEVEAIKAERQSTKPPLLSAKDLAAPFEDADGAEGTKIEELIAVVDDGVIARLAYAFSSPQKVRIVRILLTDGPLSAAQVGERTGLTTGSLYHHLRELAHADVIEPTGRNLHTISPLGRRAALALFRLTR